MSHYITKSHLIYHIGNKSNGRKIVIEYWSLKIECNFYKKNVLGGKKIITNGFPIFLYYFITQLMYFKKHKTRVLCFVVPKHCKENSLNFLLDDKKIAIYRRK